MTIYGAIDTCSPGLLSNEGLKMKMIKETENRFNRIRTTFNPVDISILLSKYTLSPSFFIVAVFFTGVNVYDFFVLMHFVVSGFQNGNIAIIA